MKKTVLLAVLASFAFGGMNIARADDAPAPAGDKPADKKADKPAKKGKKAKKADAKKDDAAGGEKSCSGDKGGEKSCSGDKK